jgi:DNA-binding response OmpR family regulator
MRLLVVEDDPELSTEIVIGLRSVGYVVDLASTLAEADEKLAANGYDCLILDTILPDGDSVQLAHGQHTPVLMLTALPDATGPHDHLVKPFTFATLAARVATLSRQAAPQSTLRIADLELDPSRKRVRRGGVPLSLNPKEFSALELLAVRAGEVVSRTDLLEHCWTDHGSPLSTVVDSVIAQLRVKLGPPIMINTVGNAGYVIGNQPAA